MSRKALSSMLVTLLGIVILRDTGAEIANASFPIEVVPCSIMTEESEEHSLNVPLFMSGTLPGIVMWVREVQ